MPSSDDPVRAWRRHVWGRRILVSCAIALAAGAGAVITARWPEPAPERTRVYTPPPAAERRPTPAVQIRSPAPRVDPSFDTGVAGPPDLDELVDEINLRRSRGAGCAPGPTSAAPLREDPDLSAASASHARWMIRTGDYGHVTRGNPAGDDPAARARYAGFDGAVAENIAWGQPTPQAAVRWWARSPTHCRVLMDPEARWVGVAVEPDPETSGWVWVMMTGA